MKYYKSIRINQFDLQKSEVWWLLFIREIPYPLASDSDIMWWQGVCFSPTYAGILTKTDPEAWEECTEEEFIINAEKFSADRISLTHKNGSKILQAKTENSKDPDPKQD